MNPLRFLFQRAAQVGADQTQRPEPGLCVNQYCRNIREFLSGTHRVIGSWPEVKSRRREAAPVWYPRKRDRIPRPRIPLTASSPWLAIFRKLRREGLFILAGHRMAFVTGLRILPGGVLGAAAAHDRAENEALAGDFANQFVTSVR